MRVFVAIEISKTQILENIKKFQENVKIDAKPTRTDQIHFTLQFLGEVDEILCCLLYTSPSPRDATLSRMPSSA